MSEPLLHYESRLTQLQTGIAQARLDSSISAAIWTIATAILVVVVVYAVRQQLSFVWTLLPAPFVFAAARRYRSHQQTQNRCWRLQLFYTRAVQRLRGDWSEGPPGEEFIDPAHQWTSDLNIFGEASLFQLLCTARTAIGRQGLALYLSTTPSAGVMSLRREAIQELAGNTGIRERIALLGKFDFRESKPESFHQWLKSPALAYPKAIQITARITSFILIVLIVTAITGLMSWINLAFAAAPILAFHAITGLLFRDRIKRMLATLHAASVETQVFREGLALLEARNSNPTG